MNRQGYLELRKEKENKARCSTYALQSDDPNWHRQTDHHFQESCDLFVLDIPILNDPLQLATMRANFWETSQREASLKKEILEKKLSMVLAAYINEDNISTNNRQFYLESLIKEGIFPVDWSIKYCKQGKWIIENDIPLKIKDFLSVFNLKSAIQKINSLDRWSPLTRKNCISQLKNFYTFLKSLIYPQKIHKRKFDQRALPAKSSHRKSRLPLTLHQCATFLRQLEKESERDELIGRLFLYAGTQAKIREILSLNTSQINFANNSIKFTKGEITCSKPFMKRLQALTAQSTALVFTTANGNQIQESYIKKVFRRASQAKHLHVSPEKLMVTKEDLLHTYLSNTLT